MIARAALLLALASSAAAAQTVRGRVFLPDSVAPAPGVLVAASDARGIDVSRTVTDERGQFVLNLTRAGSVAIRALRVGYRPTTGPSLDVAAGDTVAVRIVLTREAVRLSAVTVRRSDPCRARDDTRTRVADVWEEARKALLLANTGRAGRGLIAEWTQYGRQFDSSGTRLVDQVVHLTRAPSERPFRSQDAALLTGLPPGEMRVEARMPGYHLAVGIVDVRVGRTPAQVLLERIDGTALDAVRVEAEADERVRYGAFEARRRSGSATASITRDEMLARGVVNAWQMLRNVSAVELIEGPEGVLPASRRVQSMDLRSNNAPCYMRLAIDGVLIPEAPVNLAHRMPPVSEIHGIEVFGGPATIPSEYVGDQRNMVCGLIVVWTR